MEIMKDKRGVSTQKIDSYILLFIGGIVLMKLVAKFLPQLMSAGNELNETGVGGADLFASDGILWFILLVAIFYLLYKSLWSGKK